MEPKERSETSFENEIDGVYVQSLKQIVDERGAVLHWLRRDSPRFTQFGEAYFSQVNPWVVKGWKRHQKMTQNFVVPFGRILLVLVDDRPSSPTKGTLQSLELGRPDCYSLITIPPMIWYGFQGISVVPALLANCTDLPHDPAESETLPLESGPKLFQWKTPM